MDILLDTRPSQGPITCPFLSLLKNLLQSPHSNNSLSLSHLSSARSCLLWLEATMLRIMPLLWPTMSLSIKVQHLNPLHWQVISSIPYSLLSLWIELLLVMIHGSWTQEQVIILYVSYLFQSYTIVSHCVVEFPNGESTHVTHIGSVKLSASLILEHVLCVLSFSFNLLSVSQHTQKLPLCLVFLSQFCFIQDLSC